MKNFVLATLTMVLTACASAPKSEPVPAEPMPAMTDSAPTEGERAPASARLACWDLYAKAKSPPVMTAVIEGPQSVSNLTFHQRGATLNYWESLPHRPLEGPFDGELNTNNRSPYKGTINYVMSKEYRLILPVLDEDLAKKHIKGGANPNPRQNGILVLDSSLTNSGGDSYMRMRCIYQ